MATGNTLPGLDYNALISAQDLQTYRNVVEQQLLNRFLLSMGSPPNTVPQTGIVDLINPTQISASETTRPLLVTISTLDVLKVAVTSGTVVTPSGAVVSVATNLSLDLARTLANDVNVVFVENALIPGGTTQLNDYQVTLASQEVQDPDNLKTVLLTDFLNTTLFPPTRRNNIVVIAVVSVVSTVGSSVELQIDLTNTTYAYNRPWFSIKDIQHRSYIGTDVVTAQNPHGTSYNDLSTSSTVGIFQGLCLSGLVVSRDVALSKMVGTKFCQETIDPSRIKVDTGGTVTSRSPYGKVNARYVELQGFPASLGSTYELGKPGNAISTDLIGGTNILVFGPQEDFSGSLTYTVEYTEAQGLLPPVQAPSNILTFTQPVTDETLVVGGLIYPSIPDPTLDFDGAGPFPRYYTAYLLKDGTIHYYSEVLLPAVRLDILGTTLYSISKQMSQYGRIRMGLTKANVVSGMQIQVVLYGKDTLGSSINETLTISTAAGYQDESVPSTNYDAPGQSVISSNVFSTLDSIQVISRTSDGPLATIQLWGEAEAGTSPGLNDAIAICLVGWNGQGITTIEDRRPVSMGYFRSDVSAFESLGALGLEASRVYSQLQNSASLSHTSTQLFAEDFENLRYFDTAQGFFAAVGAVGVITVVNSGFLIDGDSIDITPSKTITAKTSSANPSVGEFLIGATNSETVANMVATLNNSTFDSSVQASVGTGNNINLQLLDPLGSEGNTYAITPHLNNSLALSVTGFLRGFDAYGESYMNRATVGLWSPFIPQDGNLSTGTYYYRNRYRSRSVSLPVGETYPSIAAVKFGILIHGQDRYYPSSIRMRGSEASAPTNWTEWLIAVPDPSGIKGLYIVTFDNPVHKIQVEIYGKARGVTVFNLNSN